MDASSGISSNLYDASTASQCTVGQSLAQVASNGGGGAVGAAASGASTGASTGGGGATGGGGISQVATMQSTVNALIAGGEGMSSQLMKMAVALLILDMLMGNDSQKSGSDPMELLTAAMLGQALGGGSGGGGATGGTLMSFSSTSEVSVTQTTSTASAQQAYAGDTSHSPSAPMVNMVA